MDDVLNENAKAQIKAIGKQLEILNDAFESGNLPEEDFAEHIEALRDQLEEVTQHESGAEEEKYELLRTMDNIIKLHRLPLFQLRESEGFEAKIKNLFNEE
jgi:hypothetical protein